MRSTIFAVLFILLCVVGACLLPGCNTSATDTTPLASDSGADLAAGPATQTINVNVPAGASLATLTITASNGHAITQTSTNSDRGDLRNATGADDLHPDNRGKLADSVSLPVNVTPGSGTSIGK